jgi:hypothetical protein
MFFKKRIDIYYLFLRIYRSKFKTFKLKKLVQEKPRKKLIHGLKGQSHEIFRVILLHRGTYLRREKNRCWFYKF